MNLEDEETGMILDREGTISEDKFAHAVTIDVQKNSFKSLSNNITELENEFGLMKLWRKISANPLTESMNIEDHTRDSRKFKFKKKKSTAKNVICELHK